MAIYRLEAKIIGRRAKDKSGKAIPGREVSVVAKAAYRSGEKLRDERIGKTFNYKARAHEVVHAELVAPQNAPDWMQTDRARLWNTIEKTEKRSDSQLAREFIAALPVELSREEQIETIRAWCKQEFADKGFVADFAIHRSKDGKNPHAHVLVTTRPVEDEGFGPKPKTDGKFNGRGDVGKGAKNDLDLWRESWEKRVNASLEAAGERARVDRRSLKDRGIDREPQPKIGPDATAMTRKGLVADTERHRLVRAVDFMNRIRSAIRAVRETGEVQQLGADGAGNTWWERASHALGRMREGAAAVLRDETSGGGWRSQIELRRERERGPEPEPSR